MSADSAPLEAIGQDTIHVLDTSPERAADLFDQLSAGRRARVISLMESLLGAIHTEMNEESDIATIDFVTEFGDLLLQHHQVSAEPLSKDRFEYAMVGALNDTGHRAVKTPNGNPGDDLRVDGSPWSLKSQADKSISRDFIHVSKWMELGRGDWVTLEDVAALRETFFHHMTSYDRIFTLRCLVKTGGTFEYELVEIPKELLLRSAEATIQWSPRSNTTPPAAFANVTTDTGALALTLLFDGGGERKLTIRKLDKRLCVVHASWRFQTQH